MKKLMTGLLLAVICFGCAQKAKKEAVKNAPPISANATNKAPLFTYGNPVLLQYDRYINALDTQLIEMGSQSLETFKLLFKNQPAAVCDTAYYIFNQFHYRLSLYLYWHMEADSMNYEDMVFPDEQGKMRPLSKKQIARKQVIEKNGYLLEGSEGSAFINQDQHFISQQFGKYVSTGMKQYLAQLDKEQQEALGEDDGFILKPESLADHTIWWEQFSKANTASNFLYGKEALDNYNATLSMLVYGSDHTGGIRAFVVDHVVVDSLSEYYQKAWAYLAEKYPQSKANTIVAPYFKAFQMKDTAAINRLYNQFTEGNAAEY
jgi:hypothetical protein